MVTDTSVPACKKAIKVDRWSSTTRRIIRTCDGNALTQACAHYWSAIHIGKHEDEFTCSNNHEGAKNPKAKDDWKTQHNDAFYKYTTDQYHFNGNPNRGMQRPDCEADEWPPALFWPNSNRGQAIRWVPGQENRIAGQIWGDFCNTMDGGPGNGQTDKDGSYNTKGGDDALVEFGKKSKVDKDDTTHFDIATYQRAIFKIAFAPGDDNCFKENDYRLEDNPCWPKKILPKDPGFVLLGNDPWYNNRPDAKRYTDQYRNPRDGLFEELERNAAAQGSNQGGNSGQSHKRELKVIDEGVLVVREANLTRRVTDEEIEHDIEVIKCKDRTCSKERRDLADEDGLTFIDGQPPRMSPPEEVPVQPTLVPRGERSVSGRLHRRGELNPGLPAATGVAGTEGTSSIYRA